MIKPIFNFQFSYTNNYASKPEPPKPVAITESEKKRLEKIYNYAKEKMKEMIIKGRKEKDLAKEDKNLIKKIENIQLGDTYNDHHILGCLAEEANAAYIPYNHKVYVCPSALRLSDANLAMILGHEIGHSIDPCGISCDHFKVNQSAVDNYLSNYDRDKDPTGEDPVKLLDQIGSQFGNFGRHIRDLKFQDLSKTGIIELVSERISPDKYPLKKIKSCLMEKQNFDGITEADIESELSTIESYYKRMGTPISKVELEYARKQIKESFECLGTSNKMSEMREAVSDVAGSFVLSEYLRENPPRNDIDSIASLGLFFETACRPQTPVGIEILKLPHPHEVRRLYGIMLQFPGVLKNFSGCESTNLKNTCFSEFQYLENQPKSQSKGKSNKLGQQ